MRVASITVASLLISVAAARAQSTAFPPSGTSPPASPSAPASPPVRMSAVDVSAGQEQLLNSIDRKVYDVSHDVAGLTGSAADVLKTIPSVDVDLDGNVSLRGDTNVQVLVDGRTTALMGRTNMADVLSEFPADAIDHIEVITNPSAKYKPDGSAGIINIVLKKQRRPGLSGSARVTVGDDRRYGVGVGGNYNPGKCNISVNVSIRQDDRVRTSSDRRTYTDPVSGLPASTQSAVYQRDRPLYQLGQLSFDYAPDSFDTLGEAVNYSYRYFTRYGSETDETTIGSSPMVYYRPRYDPEYERDVESKSTYDRRFGRDDDTLSFEVRVQHHTEDEDEHYTDLYVEPAAPTTYDHIRLLTNEPQQEALAEYSNTLDANSRVEAGFDVTNDDRTDDHLGESTDPVTGIFVNNPNLTNEFILRQTIAAAYGTYERTFGAFGAEAGLRLEDASVRSDQVTSALTFDQRSFKPYPTLHLTYDLSATGQLQLSYSHRINRPEADDFNPYPEYQDPYNLRAGNPQLKPEEIHSVEGGYQYKNDDTTYLAALFYKYAYNSFTSVSEYINSTTLLTTEENIGKNQSGGVEFAATVSPWASLTLNASGDVYYNQIDASNLGYSSYRSTVAWTGKLSADYAWSKKTLWQFSANYLAKRLTPQGYRLPVFGADLGVRHELRGDLSVAIAISNLFNTEAEETILDTPVLHDDYVRRRNSRYIYAGIVYSFGSGKKKKKEDLLQFGD
jgi:outer membrane receptor protein involved in Fe transport